MITWTQRGSQEAHYTHGEYLFKRYGKDRYKYELWHKGELLDNTITDEFQIQRIILYGHENRRGWQGKQR